MANNSSWKNMACHEDIGMTYFIIIRSIVLTTIKPCTWCGISILPSMENANNQPTLCKGPSQSIFVV
jgi:hypothetical protein